jgi:heavy metal translocating P-type ATPase
LLGSAGVGRASLIAALAAAAIVLNIVMRAAGQPDADVPLLVALALGGALLIIDLAGQARRLEFGADHLAGIAIVTAALLHQPLAGVLVVLMLSGGQALESFAAGRASSVLQALAGRMPSVVHRRRAGTVDDVAVADVSVGDEITVFPHEICPIDGVVVEGHSVMDESYLTGEPFTMPKVPGSDVFSGAVNGDRALTVRATRIAADSRYARIVGVLRDSEQRRPKIRRMADRLGALYTPLALALAIAAWVVSRDPMRFLAVLVVATPCPLLIGIPVAIIGSISLAAKRGVVIRDPAILETIDTCRTIVLDKTGTLTYGTPALVDRFTAPDANEDRVLQLAASLERYSKHPLAAPIREAAASRNLPLIEPTEIREQPGRGLDGIVDGIAVRILGRRQIAAIELAALPAGGGLKCVVLVEGRYAATYRFRDAARNDSRTFVEHLGRRHRLDRVLLVSGDRESEVRYLADRVGITEVHAAQTPEQKVAITESEVRRAPTLFVGDGINDAPALVAATVGIAFGHQSDITTEAAGAVVMDTSLKRLDELFHIARRMRHVALESAIGGMAASVLGMAVAAAGWLPPVPGAVLQEAIDLAAVLNALRAAVPGGALSDYDS